MIVVNIEKVEHTIKGVAEISVHSVSLLNLMKKHGTAVLVHFWVDFVVNSLGETFGIVL